MLSTPSATYRLQFHSGFTFTDATAIVDYLDALGVSHCYASSYLRAVPGSTHGYDVADPTMLNPEVGDAGSFAGWVAALRGLGMGHIVDVVPNHMGIARSSNPWWQDVLENGESSRYARVFDIDWHPLKPELEHKVLLPVLGDAYGNVLERQELRLEYEQGAFRVRYYEQWFPVAPGTYGRVLGMDQQALLDRIGAESDEGMEFLSIMTAIGHLPGRQALAPEHRLERDREKEVIKRRLAALTARSAPVREHVERAVAAFNGVAGQPESFDRLDDLLSVQGYRLSYWRVAAEEINYRRFFDINELAAIRMEDPDVFELVHGFLFELLARGDVDGVRIDHVDGLFDPADYLRRLQAKARELRPDRFGDGADLYVVVEKILAPDEPLPAWPVAGTTGYDYLAVVNALFVDPRNRQAFDDIYERFTRLRVPYPELAYRGKQLILRVSMSSELNVLAHQLNRFSERNRHYRDFTLNSLTQAMREIIACFPVYRTYVAEGSDLSERDRIYIEHAVQEAKRRNPNRPGLVFDFVRDLLLNRAGYVQPDERSEQARFVGKFQQVTSPVTAKGIEDTALYIFNRLVSLNEVGSEPERFGLPPDDVHRWMSARAAEWPHGLSATSTHDTKRSEDVRARLNALSELPGAWKQATATWARLNRRGRTTIDGQSYPSRNEEYLLYQTLVGSWPAGPMNEEEERVYRERIVGYMLKAMREAKVHTSWVNPSEPHEQAMQRFVEAVLDPGNEAFRAEFLPFVRRVGHLGIYNALAQTAVKLASPGVPDFYQGSELWDLSLVDPDNRRPVDYERRRALLQELDAAAQDGRAALADRLMTDPTDDRVKLYATTTLLRLRRRLPDLFAAAGYTPLAAEGVRQEQLFAFARRHEGREVLLAVPRLSASLAADVDARPLGERAWGDTVLRLPDGAASRYVDVFTGQVHETKSDGARAWLPAAELFARFPVACLESH